MPALAGVGLAVGGRNAVQWGWSGGKGLAMIWAGMIIALAIALGFGATVYLISKYAILVRKYSIKKGLYIALVYFFVVTTVLTLTIGEWSYELNLFDSVVYKGSPSLHLDKLPEVTVALAIVLKALVVSVFSILVWLPYVYAKVAKEDHSERQRSPSRAEFSYSMVRLLFGPVLWKRPRPTEESQGGHVPDYRVHGRDEPENASTQNAARKLQITILLMVEETPNDVESKSDPETSVEDHEPDLLNLSLRHLKRSNTRLKGSGGDQIIYTLFSDSSFSQVSLMVLEVGLKRQSELTDSRRSQDANG